MEPGSTLWAARTGVPPGEDKEAMNDRNDAGGGSSATPLEYRLCPRCSRAVPAHSGERYCINDGAQMLEACPVCKAAITSPYSRFCAFCGSLLTAPGAADG